MATELTQISGTVVAIIFQNEENGYTVLRLLESCGDEVTVVGCIPFAAPGEHLVLQGEWVRHPTHGEQFRLQFATRTLPQESEEIYEYLASHVIKGIGPATATLIVSCFGEDTLHVIENQPEKLATIRGISLKKANEISSCFQRQMGLRRLMEFLDQYTIGMQIAMNLYRQYGNTALEILKDNPYILVEDTIGGTFSHADAIAFALGFEQDAPQRVMAATLFVLSHNLTNGHCFIPQDKLIAAVVQMTRIRMEEAAEGLEVLVDEGMVVTETIAGVTGCYLSRLYASEQMVAARVAEMAHANAPLEAADMDTLIAYVEAAQNITYAPLQRHTLEIAANEKIMLITGGPGTGKTTSIRAILALYDKLGLKTQLTAPTGRAAKRLSEVTGREAYTIHRLLEAGYHEERMDELSFRRCKEDPLKADAVILDECSMVDITLMQALLDALPEDCRLVLVGDADQLPPVGPGCVFLDLLRSQAVETVCLTEIFRQTAESKIIVNAHHINQGVYPELSGNTGDFFFLRRRDPENALQTILSLCAERLPNKMGFSPMDIQVLCPTRKGVCGTASLNRHLQQSLNPPMPGKNEHTYGEIIFREGDRVMQIRNNYDILWKDTETDASGLGIYNGDVGQILSIQKGEETVTICFDNRLAVYPFDLLHELEHAFAMTVHKSQGSEYRVVILSVQNGSPRLMTRSVLYTAVTRAKELLVIVGDDASVISMIDNFRQTRRYSGLRARLKNTISGEKH